MKSSDDLKNLLDRLKDEVGPLPQAGPEPEAAPSRPEVPRKFPQLVPKNQRTQPSGGRWQRSQPFPGGGRAQPFPEGRQERPGIAYRGMEPRPVQEPQLNTPWSENKESMLFGMLASLAAALGGGLAGFEYLVLIGAVVFALFSLVMVISLLRSTLSYTRGGGGSSALAARVDALSQKVETLSSRMVSGGPGREEDF